MRLYKILCLGILFFVLVRHGLFAQCGQTTHRSAVSTAPRLLPTLTIAKPYSEDRTVVLQLEMTERGSVRDVEVFEDPGTLRAAALSAAVKFASTEKYLDRRTWPFITVVVRFPQNGHGTPRVGQGVVGGVPGCVSGGSMGGYVPWPVAPTEPPSWLFNTPPVIPVLAAQRTPK
jgi:hypothetical protein